MKNQVKVNTRDLYQLLLAEMRYAFTRNNHLMPGGAIEHCKTYLYAMGKVDSDMARHTAKQIIEEINFEISTMRFHYSIKSIVEEYRCFIEWLSLFIAETTNKYAEEFGSRCKLNSEIAEAYRKKKFVVILYEGDVHNIKKELNIISLKATDFEDVDFTKVFPCDWSCFDGYFRMIKLSKKEATIDYGSHTKFIRIIRRTK